MNLSDCVDQAGRIDEAARLALDGFEAGRSLGLGTGYRAMLLSEAAQRTLPRRALGRRRAAGGRARSRCERAGSWTGVAHATVAQIAAARGDPAAAQDGFARAREMFKADASAMWTAPLDACAAELELSAGRATAARDVVTRALARSEGQEYPFFTARLHWVGLRAEAELAEEARARFDRAGASARRGPGPRTWPSGSPGRSPRRRPARPHPSCSSTRRCARPS